MTSLNNKKKISVVIPSVNGLPIIKECLESIYRQDNSDISEVIVVDCSNEQTRKVISETFKGVTLIHPQRGKTIPELKAIGIKEAKCDILAMIEDHCIVPEDWFTEILKAHESEHIAIGGAVENGLIERTIDWAVYFFEYSAFMNPVSEGTTTALPGNNVSYNRSAMKYFDDLLEQNLWESFWHKRLMKNEVLLYAAPDIIVYHNRHFRIMRFWYLSYIHGCNHAVANMRRSNLKKLLWVISAVFIPAILTFRIGRRILRKKRYLKEFIKASPIILWFHIGWTAGEFMGTLTGRTISEKGWGEEGSK